MARWASGGAFVDELVSNIAGVATKAGRETLLESNKAINPISRISTYTGAVEATGRFLGGEGFGEAITRTFGKNVVEEGGKVIAKDGYDAGKIAGSFVGAAAAGRLISGGGLTKDKNGNANLIGVPFV